MNNPNPFSTPADLEPESAFAPNPSVSQAAQDLRAAAGEKAKELACATENKAAELKARAVEGAHHLKEAASEKAHQFKEVATQRAAQLKSSAETQWHDTRDKAKELHVTAEDYVRQNPTKAILGAIGVGFLVGLVVRR